MLFKVLLCVMVYSHVISDAETDCASLPQDPQYVQQCLFYILLIWTVAGTLQSLEPPSVASKLSYFDRCVRMKVRLIWLLLSLSAEIPTMSLTSFPALFLLKTLTSPSVSFLSHLVIPPWSSVLLNIHTRHLTILV